MISPYEQEAWHSPVSPITWQLKRQSYVGYISINTFTSITNYLATETHVRKKTKDLMSHSPVSPITWQLKPQGSRLKGDPGEHSPVSPITWQLKHLKDPRAKCRALDIHQYHQLPGN